MIHDHVLTLVTPAVFTSVSSVLRDLTILNSCNDFIRYFAIYAALGYYCIRSRDLLKNTSNHNQYYMIFLFHLVCATDGLFRSILYYSMKKTRKSIIKYFHVVFWLGHLIGLSEEPLLLIYEPIPKSILVVTPIRSS